MAIPEITLAAGDELHGFTVQSVDELPSIRCRAVILSHAKSGARMLHLAADDPENLFAAAFRTPPPDSTGLPHILEHTVLCGSKRYPVKDPFVELLKTSLATFLNAMTYPDKTVYPVASMNENDFYNLMGVYCDAVFHPLITEKHFKQEGHHFEFAETGNTGSELLIKGIVYNEMKGAYSDLDGVMDRELCKSIMPDNAYGLDSGGDPEVIPQLTYEQFRNFHAHYYHPSNSLIFTYGNLPVEKHLEFLNREYLSGFDKIVIDTGIAKQPRWSEPVRKSVPYPIGPDEDTKGKAAVTINFLENDVTDPVRTMAMSLLDSYLLGNAASPLRKALIDSKLGEELTDSGYASYQRDTFFSVGLKGTDPEKADEIEKLVFTTLEKLVDEGLDREKIESSLHRMELSSREIASQYPLRLMNRVYNSWLYDADPLHLLKLDEHLSELRKLVENRKGFLEELIRESLLANKHYSVLTFVPDTGYTEKHNKDFAGKMAAAKDKMDSETLARIAREAAELESMQNTPNSQEALATLPRLALSDVSPEPLELPTEVIDIGGRTLLYTDVFSGGVTYLRLGLDLSGLPDDLVDYVPLYSEAFSKMGAAGSDYVVMAEREASCTGGIHAGAGAGGSFTDSARVRPFFSIGMKALDHKLENALEVLHDRLFACDLSDTGRLKDIILQTRMQMKSHIIPAGHTYAMMYAARNISRNAALAERFGGISQIRFFDHLAENFDSSKDGIIDKLSQIREFLLGRDRLVFSLVGSNDSRKLFESWGKEITARMPEVKIEPDSAKWETIHGAGVGIATPADVAYVASVFPAVGASHPDAAALMFLGAQLGYGYLWNEIRVKGGAYGGKSGFNMFDGIFTFASYRDPRVKETLDVYGRVCDHIINEMDLSPKTMEQAIIGTVKGMDQPLRPEQSVSTALNRHIQGSNFERRKEFRARLLSLTADDVRRVTEEVMRPALMNPSVCVISSREKLEAANKQATDAGLVIENL